MPSSSVLCVGFDDLVVLYQHIMKKDGFDCEFHCSENAVESVQHARTIKPDLIIVHWNYELKDGRRGADVFRQIRTDDELKDIPIVILTASLPSWSCYVIMGDELSFSNPEITRVLSIPIDVDEFAKSVRELLVACENMEIRINYGIEFDEQTAFELESKGYYAGVTVTNGDGLEFSLVFYDPVRLAQDIEEERIICDRNLVIVPKVTKEWID